MKKAVIKKMGGRLLSFAANGEVTDITNLKASEISPKPVLDQMKAKAAEVVEALMQPVPEIKAKRGRKPKASAD